MKQPQLLSIEPDPIAIEPDPVESRKNARPPVLERLDHIRAPSPAVVEGATISAGARAFPLEEEPPASSAALVEILPAGFPLPSLIKFVPNPALREAADAAAATALAIEVTGLEGIAAADAAVADVRAGIAAIEAHFEEPAELANKLHKGITGTRAAWIAPAKSSVDVVSLRIRSEKNRLEQLELRARRKAQEEADQKAREEAERAAEEARRAQAPAPVVEELERQAQTAKAPPVAPATAGSVAQALKHSTTVSAWKVTIEGTPREANQEPKMEELTPAQRLRILRAMKDALEGRAPLLLFEINWPYLKARAKADKGAFAIAEFEAYDAGASRAKPARKA